MKTSVKKLSFAKKKIKMAADFGFRT